MFAVCVSLSAGLACGLNAALQVFTVPHSLHEECFAPKAGEVVSREQFQWTGWVMTRSHVHVRNLLFVFDPVNKKIVEEKAPVLVVAQEEAGWGRVGSGTQQFVYQTRPK